MAAWPAISSFVLPAQDVDRAVVWGAIVGDKGTHTNEPGEVVAASTSGAPSAFETHPRLTASSEASECRLRTVLDTMLDGVTIQSAIRDEHGRIVDFRVDYANSAIGVIGGTAGSLQAGRTLLELFPAHRTNGLFDRYVNVVETGIAFASDAFRYVDPEAAGGPLDQLLGLRATRIGDGYVLSVRDVTDRHRTDLVMRRLAAVRDEVGVISSYVGLNRDVTRERALAATQQRIARERALIAGTLANLQVLPTVGATADLICRQVASMTGVASASLAYFTPEGAVVSLAFVRADGVPVRLRRLPFQRSRTLRKRAEGGPWVEEWVRRPWHPYDRLHTDLKTRALAYAPVRHGSLIGLLTIASAEVGATSRLTEILPALLEFADFSGALLGPAIVDLTEIGVIRDRILQMITEVAFRPVFQPIVDLATGEHAGYEALTRFSSGTAPDVVFADARVAGLEAELELATLAASISAAAPLPPGAWLSLNVSPDLVAADDRLGELLRQANRPIVLEVTEHIAIPDYAALRATVGRLGPEVRVAVDDAGSGIANFSHIVELRPAFVKLDIGLVRSVDTDLTRQALVIGLLRFAGESASQTVAEGVETEAERTMLWRLGVTLVQGYLVGRPAPAAEWVAHADALASAARDEAPDEPDTVAAVGTTATTQRRAVAAVWAHATAEREDRGGEGRGHAG